MADPAEIFRVLDAGSGVGTALDQAVDATTAAAALRGLVGFAFKDSTGKVVLPQLTSDGRVPITTQSPGTIKESGAGELAAGSGTIVDITGAVVTLTTTKKYTNISVNMCCRQDSLFQLVHNDNGVETVHREFIVGPGQYSIIAYLDNLEITAGSTGTQELKIKAKNFSTLSSLRASVATLEEA